MSANMRKNILELLTGPYGYGTPLVGWEGQTEFFRAANAPTHPGVLASDLARTFFNQVHFLARTARPVTVYRGYEAADLKDPYPHFDLPASLLNLRKPGRPDGMWWTQSRPSMSIDPLYLSHLQKGDEVRGRLAVTREWNRLDYFIEAQVPPGTLVYVGRATWQQDTAAYGGTRYPGGAVQFRLIARPKIINTYEAKY